jgi:hypothetical protein
VKGVKGLVLDNSRELCEMKIAIAILLYMVLLCERPVKRFASMSLGGETKMGRQKHFFRWMSSKEAVSDALMHCGDTLSLFRITLP